MENFKTCFDPEFLTSYQAGTMAYRYKDTRCLKSPIDLAIYLRVLWNERPKTIIEIGSKEGGGARLLRDLARLNDLDSQVVSIDLQKPDLPDTEDVRFLIGDAHDLAPTFKAGRLYDLPRPWLVIEDSAHTYAACLAVLEFFDGLLAKDEMLVMEDGVLDDLGMRDLYEGGPNRAIGEYLAAHPGAYEVQRNYCDMFGPNATYNPNGYLRKL